MISLCAAPTSKTVRKSQQKCCIKSGDSCMAAEQNGAVSPHPAAISHVPFLITIHIFSIIYHCRKDAFFPFVDGDWHAEWKWIWKLITAHKHLPILIQARQECAKDLMLQICVTTQIDFFFYICWSTKNPAVSWHQDVQTLGGKKCWHSVQGFLQLIKVHHLSQKTGWTCWLQTPLWTAQHPTHSSEHQDTWDLLLQLHLSLGSTCCTIKASFQLDLLLAFRHDWPQNPPECLMRL